ncbi:HAMP domain-containing protein [candidate division FCPU426 bacterium]|nr:HAMP domain-containing protein [candidate division FCPU426 bacterium]
MQWRRKNYLINKEFQIRYIIRILFGIIVMALIVAFTVYYTTWVRIMDAFYNVPQIASQFAPLFHSMNQQLVLVLILFLVVFAVVSIFVSHSIAGPMYRFEKTLQAIQEGDLTLNIGLRKSDEFRNLAECVNNMINTLRISMSKNKRLTEEINEVCKKIQTVQPPAKSSQVRGWAQDVENLKQLVQELQEENRRFKLDP